MAATLSYRCGPTPTKLSIISAWQLLFRVRNKTAANAPHPEDRPEIGAARYPIRCNAIQWLSPFQKRFLVAALVRGATLFATLGGVFPMKIRGLFATVALLLAVGFSSHSAYATDYGPGFLGTFPFYSGDYPYYDGDYPPNPLIAPYGYYGCRAGCCRRPVWTGRHWHNVTACHYQTRSSARRLRLD